MGVEAGMSLHPGQVVCFETFRRERERRVARVLPYLAPLHTQRPESPFLGYVLTDREIDHRARMLRHLANSEENDCLSKTV